MTFPADRDLPPDAVSVASVIRPERNRHEAARIVAGLREEYRKRELRGDPDIIVIAVPAGNGRPFLEGLADALKASGQYRGTTDLDT